MTEAENILNKAKARERLAYELSDRAVAWCRENKALVEALVGGTWQGVPKEPTLLIVKALAPFGIKRILDFDEVELLAEKWKGALAVAPKKPE